MTETAQVGHQAVVENGRITARYIRITCARKALGKTFADGEGPGLEIEFQIVPGTEQAARLKFIHCDPKSAKACSGFLSP